MTSYLDKGSFETFVVNTFCVLNPWAIMLKMNVISNNKFHGKIDVNHSLIFQIIDWNFTENYC